MKKTKKENDIEKEGKMERVTWKANEDLKQIVKDFGRRGNEEIDVIYELVWENLNNMVKI